MNSIVKNTDLGNFINKFFGDDYSHKIFMPSINTLGHSNVIENENEFLVEMLATGLKKEDVKIDLDNDVLSISSIKKESKEEKGDNYCRKEFHYGEFDRSFTVPKTIDKKNISAKMEDGILTVTLPKLTPTEKSNENISIKIQ